MGERVLLINMPFSGVDRPQIGIGTLKASLLARGVPCDVRYFNVELAKRFGARAYQELSTSVAHTAFVGEWLFAQHFFGSQRLDVPGYLRHLRERMMVERSMVRNLLRLRRHVSPFLDFCLASVDWSHYSIIGFTSTFEQNLASLSLARSIKQRHPEKTIVMGGGNCEDRMGLGLHRCFPFLDYVFSGEADHSFIEFVERKARREPVEDIRGLVHRSGGESVFTGPAQSVARMDALPYPNYDDYFDQLRDTSIPRHVAQTLQIETSRGCWWGAKHHCTFCGLNDETMGFRAKSKQRVMDEILHLTSRYSLRQIAAVDDIMPVEYFRDLLPELARRELNLSLFYETKANLKKEQVQILRDAGVTMIQPGIESLHSRILRLMDKGVSPLQNVELLKWCRQFGVHPSWNLLYGFPGERPEDYEEMARLMDGLFHLSPPEASGQIRLDRFSPYFQDPESHGLTNARPLEVYRYLYALEECDLRDIAYFYEYDYRDGLEPLSYFRPIDEIIERWRIDEARGASLRSHSPAPGVLVIEDSRANTPRSRVTLRGWQKDLYDHCETARALLSIRRAFLDADPAACSAAELHELLDALVTDRLMARDGERYLSLAVAEPTVHRETPRGPGHLEPERQLQEWAPAGTP